MAENSKSSEEEDAAAEAEEKQALAIKTNQSEQANEANNTRTQEKEVSSNIVNSKDPSASANANNVNIPPSDQPPVPYVILPPTTDIKVEEEKDDTTTQQAEQLPTALKKVAKSEITTTMVAVQPTIGVEGAIAKCTTPSRPLAASQSSSDDNDGEEKKMDDEDFAIAQPAQPRSPPTTPGIKTSGVPTTANIEPSPLGSTPQSDTTKAKSMPTPSSTACNSGGIDGRSLEELMTTDDMANATMEQKIDGVSRICAPMLPFSLYMHRSWNRFTCTRRKCM